MKGIVLSRLKMDVRRSATSRAFLPAALSFAYVSFVAALAWILQLKAAARVADSVEFAGRIRWGASASILAITIVCTAMMAAAIVRRRLGPRWFFAVMIIAATLVAVITWRGGAYAGLAGSRMVDDLEVNTGLAVRAVLTHLNAGTVVVGTFLLAAVIALGRGSDSVSVDDLAARQVETRLLLYLTATELVVGVAEIDLLYEWAVNNPWVHAKLPLNQVARAIVTASGALYTVLLLLLFVPLELRFAHWRRRLVNTHLNEGETAKEWLTRHSLESSVFDFVIRAAAIASPFLTGIEIKHLGL